MKKVVRLTEGQLKKVIENVINEEENSRQITYGKIPSKKLVQDFQRAIDDYYEGAINNWADDEQLIKLFQRDKKDLERILQVFKFNPEKAGDMTDNLDSAVREVIPPSVWVKMGGTLLRD